MQKVKIKLKYSLRAKPKDLFLALTTASYLQNWVANRVDFDSATGIFTFHWNKYKESARIAEQQVPLFVKWEWVDGSRDAGEFVTYQIVAPPGDDLIDLIVEDYCEANEENAIRSGWEKQFKRLERLVN